MWKKLLCKPRGDEVVIATGALAADAAMSDAPLESMGARRSFLIRDLLDAPADDQVDHRGLDQPSPDVSQGKPHLVVDGNTDRRA